MDAAYSCRCSVLRLFVYAVVTTVTCAKTDKPVEMPSGISSGVSDSEEPSVSWGPGFPKGRGFNKGRGFPKGKGHFWEWVILQHADTCPRSTFSTVFAQGRKRCGFWLSVVLKPDGC